MQHFSGHALAAVRGGRPGGQIWLSEEDYQGSALPRIERGEMLLLRVFPPEEKKTDTVLAPPPEEIIIEEDSAEEPSEEPSVEKPDYSSLKTSALRKLLKERGIYDPSVRKKSLMIKMLEDSDES